MGKRVDQSRKKNRAALIAAALLVVLAVTGVILARYVSSNRQRAEMLSSDFYISSNYLETTGAEYTVTDTGNGVTFQLYNFAKENVALISSEPIRYKIEAPNWIVTVKEDGVTVTPDGDGVYTFTAGGKKSHSVNLMPDSGADPKKVQVKVKSVTPYEEELSALFHLEGKTLPDYSIADNGSYVTVTIHSNDYNGAVVVLWTEAFSPDNTNPIMVSWTDDNQPGNMTLTAHTTYSLIFLKNTTAAYSKGMTEGVQINIG